MKPIKTNHLFRIVVLLALLASFGPAPDPARALPLPATPPVPPVDMFQWPWEQGLSWVAFDGFDNGVRRSPNSPHNYQMGGAIDFSPRADIKIGDDTSNYWVVAAAAGTIIKETSCYLIIDHGNGWTTEYWHLGSIQVQLGQNVSRNQRLGVIADNITQQVCVGNEHPGPHLHFVMRPKMIQTIFSGWKINFDIRKNITTFTKNGQTVSRAQPVLNIPNLQIFLREPIVWDTLYTGSIDAYRYEKWPLHLTEQTQFHITVNPVSGAIAPVIVLLNASGGEITRANGTLTSTQPAGSYFVQIQSQSGTGFYSLVAHNDNPPTVTPVVSATPVHSATPIFTNTSTPTGTFTFTNTPVPTNTPVSTNTAVSSSTPSVTNTSTPTQTAVITSTPIFTDTPIPSSTPIFTNTSTPTGTLIVTNTPAFTDTPVFSTTPVFTNTPTPTETLLATNTPISSDTPLPTNTLIPTNTAVVTNTAAASETPTPINTPIPTDTLTASATPIPTNTFVFTSTPVATATTITGPYVLTSANPLNLTVGSTGLVTVSLNNIPVEGYTSTEFTCTYDPNLVNVSNIAVASLFGADPVSGILGPQNGSFILGVAGSNGNKAMGSGTAFTFNVTGSQIGQTAIECTARVSNGQGGLQSILSIPTNVTIVGFVTPSAVPTIVPTSATLTGQVLASKSVTITLYNPDSSIAATTTANPDGTFSLTAPGGTYTVVATASGFLSAQGSVTLVNGNTSTKPIISLIAGDIDGNSIINQIDALTIGMNYNNTTPAAADLNNDGIINVLDLGILAQNYGTSGALAW